MKNSEFVLSWVVETVKKHYADDIALVLAHNTLNIDSEVKSVSYFVPITERGRSFGQTFIIAGEGYDIWGIGFKRLEQFAELKEYNITVLADAEILYSRTPEDARRFTDLQQRQRVNLNDPVLMRKNALEAYSQAKKLYLEMVFAQGSDVKLGAGYIIDYLAQAVAFSNLCYFKKGQTEQLEDLKTMKSVPAGFIELYRGVISEKSEEGQKKLCYELICVVRDFLGAGEEIKPKEHNFQDLADWYGELSYTWLRLRHYCKTKDPVKTYMWGIFLQLELNRVCSDFGIEKKELLSAFEEAKLEDFADKANEIEKEIREAITKGGGVIHEYRTAEDFLNAL